MAIIGSHQYQTDELGVNSFFTLYKSYWDDIHLETLRNATDVTVTSEIAAILMEEGIANLFYLSNNQTVSKGKIRRCTFARYSIFGNRYGGCEKKRCSRSRFSFSYYKMEQS